MAALTTQQIVLAVAVVVGLFLVGGNAGTVKDKILAFFGKVKSGDLKAGIIEAIENSAIVEKAAELKGEAGNIIGYTDMKLASNRVPGIVDPDKQAGVTEAFQIILTAIATSKVVQDKA